MRQDLFCGKALLRVVGKHLAQEVGEECGIVFIERLQVPSLPLSSRVVPVESRDRQAELPNAVLSAMGGPGIPRLTDRADFVFQKRVALPVHVFESLILHALPCGLVNGISIVEPNGPPLLGQVSKDLAHARDRRGRSAGQEILEEEPRRSQGEEDAAEGPDVSGRPVCEGEDVFGSEVRGRDLGQLSRRVLRRIGLVKVDDAEPVR